MTTIRLERLTSEQSLIGVNGAGSASWRKRKLEKTNQRTRKLMVWSFLKRLYLKRKEGRREFVYYEGCVREEESSLA